MELTAFKQHMNRTHGRLIAHMTSKAVDYASEEDVLADFKQESEDTGLPVEMVLYVHWAKHFHAVSRYARNGSLESESIESRLTDMLGYAYLMSALVEEGKEGE